MAIKVNIGGEFFDRIRQDGCYYVDKTELIYELVHESNNMVTLFTRPRRFGKTLMMTMIESFFDIRRDSRELFSGLAVSSHEDFCREWMNQVPVLFLTLKDAEGLSFQSAYGMLKIILADVCKKHAYLGTSEKVNPMDAEVFMRLQGNRADDQEVRSALLLLTRMMASHYGKPVILLIEDDHEDYYHAFLTGIFVGRGYAVESNREHGLGRPDSRLTDHRNRRILIIETKRSDSAAQMEHDRDEALKQIADQGYARGLEAYQVYCYGIAFYRKTALVKKYEYSFEKTE